MGFDLGYRSKYSSVSKNVSSSRRLILIFCSLVLFQIYLCFCVYFLACSKVSGKYFFSNPKTTDRPFTREYKRQSSVANPSIFFTESTIQPYQSTDGSHGKLAKSFAVYRFSINRFYKQVYATPKVTKYKGDDNFRSVLFPSGTETEKSAMLHGLLAPWTAP